MAQNTKKSYFVLSGVMLAVLLMVMSGYWIIQKFSMDMSGAFGASPAMRQQIIQLNHQFPLDSLTAYSLKSTDVEKVVLLLSWFDSAHHDLLKKET